MMRPVLTGIALLAAAAVAWGLFAGDGRRPVALADGDARVQARMSALVTALQRTQAQVDALDLRLKVMETRAGYKALDGTALPYVPDPLATPPRGNDIAEPRLR